MLFDHLSDSHHELQVRIIGGDGEGVSFEVIICSEALFEVLQLRQHEQIINGPVQEEGLDFRISLRSAAIRKCSRGRL